MQICTPIQVKTQKAVLLQLKKCEGKVNAVEIWLDHIQDLNLKTLFKTLKTPLKTVVVCKKPIEKGQFRGTYAELAKILIEASKNGANFIDIPLKMPKKLIKKIVQQASGKVILSHHNFKKTPSNRLLQQKIDQMRAFGADIVKIATQANALDDTVRLIALAQDLQSQKIPHIIIGMGKKGILTRVLTPHLGGSFMFAPLKPSAATASDQLTVNELKEAWVLLDRKN